LQKGFCDDFFHKLEEDACVNVAFDDTPGTWFASKTWCYTAPDCPQASALANPISVHAKVKICEHGDKMFGHYTPLYLQTLAHDEHKDLGLLVKMAYPVDHRQSWDAFKANTMPSFCAVIVSNHLNKKTAKSKKSDMEVNQQVATVLDAIKKSTMHAMVFTNMGHDESFGVVSIHMVWEITTNEEVGDEPNSESHMTPLCLLSDGSPVPIHHG
jgi:hypothetical protein